MPMKNPPHRSLSVRFDCREPLEDKGSGQLAAWYKAE